MRRAGSGAAVVKCRNPVLLEGYRVRDMEPVIAEVNCKRYSCEDCGPGRRARVVRLIRQGVRYGRAMHPNAPARLITLTYPLEVPADFNNRAHMIRTSERLRRLVQRLRRSGLELEYGRLPEATKRGRIHLHLITWGDFVPKCTDNGRRARGLPTGRGSGSPCYCRSDRPCLQRAAWAEGFGWAEVRAVRSVEAAAKYVAKYLVKQTDLQQWPRYARRFSYSKRFAGGETMGSLEQAWFDAILEVMTPLQRLERELAQVIWMGLHKRRLPHEEPPPLIYRPPPPGMMWAETGELLPIPWEGAHRGA